MKETTIRIERYGVIIYVPQRFCYYNMPKQVIKA